MNQDQPGAGSNQRQKTGGQWTPRNDGKKTWTPEQKKQWQEKKDRPRYTYESMLDQPCKFHMPNPSSPAGHTTRQCEWMRKIEQGGSGNAQAPRNDQPRQELPRQQLLSGANTQQLMLPPPPPRYDNSERRDAVHQVENQQQPDQRYSGNEGRNEYREHHQSYCVFTTEGTNKKSLQRRHMEVNAVMPAVTRYMPWSDQEITWNIKKTIPSLCRVLVRMR